MALALDTRPPLVRMLELARAQRASNPPTRDARARLQYLMEQQAQFPGRAPGGTGPTGLNANDSRGYSNMLNEQTEAVNLSRLLGGKPSLQVQAAYPASVGTRVPLQRELLQRGASTGAPAEDQDPYEGSGALYHEAQAAKLAALQAATAEAQAATGQARRTMDPMIAAREAAMVRDFQNRRVPKALPTVKGVRAYGTGVTKDLAEGAQQAASPEFRQIMEAQKEIAGGDPKVLAAQAEAKAKFVADLMKQETAVTTAKIRAGAEQEAAQTRGTTALAQKFGGTISPKPTDMAGRFREFFTGGGAREDPLFRAALSRLNINPDTFEPIAKPLPSHDVVGASSSPQAVGEALKRIGKRSNPEDVDRILNDPEALADLFSRAGQR